MDDLYSWSLFVALMAGATGVLFGILVLRRSAQSNRLPEGSIREGMASIRVALSAVALGALSLAVSVGVHWRWGHGPTSAEPMDVDSFVSAHTAFPLAGIIIAVGLGVTLYAQWRRRR